MLSAIVDGRCESTSSLKRSTRTVMVVKVILYLVHFVAWTLVSRGKFDRLLAVLE